MRQLSVVLVATLFVPAAASAQSLGEVAAREREKRKDKPVKVFTDTDLQGRSRAGSAEVVLGGTETGDKDKEKKDAKPGDPAVAGTEKKEKTEDELRAERQAAWREKLQAAQQEVQRLSQEVDQLQAALNDLTGPLYGSGRGAQMSRLEEAKKQLATAQQTASDIQEEGRRNGYR